MTLMSHSLLCVLLSLALCLTCGCVSTTTAAAQHTVMLGGNRPKVHFTLQAQTLSPATPETPEQKIDYAFQKIEESITLSMSAMAAARASVSKCEEVKAAADAALKVIKSKKPNQTEAIQTAEQALNDAGRALDLALDARWRTYGWAPYPFELRGNLKTKLLFYGNSTDYGRRQPQLMLEDAERTNAAKDAFNHYKGEAVKQANWSAQIVGKIKEAMTQAGLSEEEKPPMPSVVVEEVENAPIPEIITQRLRILNGTAGKENEDSLPPQGTGQRTRSDTQTNSTKTDGTQTNSTKINDNGNTATHKGEEASKMSGVDRSNSPVWVKVPTVLILAVITFIIVS